MSEVSNDARCKRTLRICTKISDLLNNEIQGDMDEFISNIQSIFLILCEYLHTDVDYLEMFAGESRHIDLYDHTHARVEDMYGELCGTLAKIQKILACEDKYGWFNELDDHYTCTESRDISQLQSGVEEKKLNVSEESPDIVLQDVVLGLKSRLKEFDELPLSCS